jgi:hypothetical protein
MKTIAFTLCVIVGACAVSFRGPYTGAKWNIESDGENHRIHVIPSFK